MAKQDSRVGTSLVRASELNKLAQLRRRWGGGEMCGLGGWAVTDMARGGVPAERTAQAGSALMQGPCGHCTSKHTPGDGADVLADTQPNAAGHPKVANER